jgi:predicted kinase
MTQEVKEMNIDPIITVMVGISGSGKSTYARKVVETEQKYVRMNRDSLRQMMLCGRSWEPKIEKVVMAVAKETVRAAINKGFNVIIDDTNTTIKQRKVWLDMAEELDVVINVVHMTETENNVKNRMTDPRGESEERWKMVIGGQRKHFQPLSKQELDFINNVKEVSIR